LRRYDTSRKVAGSRTGEAIEFFQFTLSFQPHYALEFTQALTEMSIENRKYVRFEVSTAVTMRNEVFWDVTICGSCKN
jgi:hypothetical protein